ncbi:putative ABC transporter permease subunit [Caproiciproducens sp. MSJ-32]|uniref:putative ABC transporter permease subunit n=1 Tax=Caproiciproducens sp. MSJ-32 TaxID=2841527 RepID=UPI001C0F5A50|nr:ABC transporter permease [Caproiciproducens sp. MSJ-32]MBU5455303.1 ABC transporter permease [Caproiciproducens sp. MSJ-32]
MNKLYILFKTTFINSTGINKLLKEKSKKERFRSISIFILILISFLSLAFSASINSYFMADALKAVGMLDLQITMSFILSVIIIIFTSIYKAQGLLFSSKDYYLLMSMPIKPNIILITKMLNLLIMNYFVLIFTFLPQAIVYFIKAENSSLYFLYLAVVFIFLPLIPIVLSSIIAFLISFISSRLKYKNLIINFGSILLIILISFYSGDLIQKIILSSKSISEGISKIYPPLIYATRALTVLNIKDLAIFIGISIVAFSIFIVIFSRSFKEINLRLEETYRRSDYKLGKITSSSKTAALLKKEARRYFSTPIYLLNTIIGPILLLIAAIATIIFGKEAIYTIAELEFSDQLIPLFIAAIVCGSLSMSCTSSSSISLEGKNLWILKSTPIVEKEIFKGKIALNILLILPAALISNLIFYISLKFSLANLIFLLIITIIYSFVTAILGLIVNLYFPKLEWTSETTVVKQSTSVFVQMLLSAFIVAVPIFVFIKGNITNINLFMILVVIYLLIVLSVLLIILNTVGVKLFKKI